MNATAQALSSRVAADRAAGLRTVPAAARLLSLAVAAVLTSSVLAGVNTLATSEPSPALIAQVMGESGRS